MKQILFAFVAMAFVVGCASQGNQKTSEVGSYQTVQVVEIQDFKFNAAADKQHIKYSFLVVNKGGMKADYNGVVTVAGKNFKKRVPISGSLALGEKKEISAEIDMGKPVYEADVYVTVEGQQVR